jgi:hypothetical protein
MGEQVVKQHVSPEAESAGNIALVLEIIFGYFGLLGIGHVYTGRLGLGIALLIGWWIYAGVAGLITTITFGLALCLFVPIGLAVPIFSGIQARSYARNTGQTGSWGFVAAIVGGGCLLVLLAFGGLFALGIFASIIDSL